MAGQLSTEQVLLLNNLMYMNSSEPFQNITSCEGKTVAQMVNEIDLNAIQDDTDYGSYITGREWKQMIKAIQSDDQLMNVQIQSVHTDTADGGGGGVSALFTDPQNNEAVVVYRGTASQEWKDDFIGGAGTDAADGVSTAQQQNALDWYESLDLDDYDTVTVSGHSKGGNKAKYVTLMNDGDTVDRCLSFDGQGFSDEFYDKYSEEIAARQDKIQNHNVESDYVNLLLNDVGDTTYYKGHNYGDGKFLENHCPNTFFDYNEDGSVRMETGSRDSNMAELDEFLNGYLRSLPEDEKQKTLAMIGEMVEAGFNGASWQQILDILLDENNTDYAANLLAYLIRYEQSNPEFIEQIRTVLHELGLDNLDTVLNVIDTVLDSEYFDTLVDASDKISSNLPDWLLKKLRDWINDNAGLDLSDEDVRKLLSIIQTANQDLDQVEIQDGADRSVASTTGSFSVNATGLSGAEDEFEAIEKELLSLADRVFAVADNLDVVYLWMLPGIRKKGSKIQKEKRKCERLEKALREIVQKYNQAEQKAIAHLN